MIPDLNENGYLPPGLHLADLDEVIDRFGTGSEQREACGQSLQWLVPMCRRAGFARLVVNGSFVTVTSEPNDVDCLLVPGPDLGQDSDALFAVRAGLPYLSIQLIAHDAELSYYLEQYFAFDREGRPKGLVEVLL